MKKTDCCLYFGTAAAGWILAGLAFSGWPIPHLFTLDTWWKWLIAIPTIMALSMCACIAFFVWLGSFEQTANRVNQSVESIISRRWPEKFRAAGKAWNVTKIVLFLPWLLALVGWSANYGD